MIKNYDFLVPKDAKLQNINTNPLTLQHPFRALVAGPTSCGKSNLLIALLIDPDIKVPYDRIIMLTADKLEDKNIALKQLFDKSREKIAKKLKMDIADVPEIFQMWDDLDNDTERGPFPEPDESWKTTPTIVIFDDQLYNRKVSKRLAEMIINIRKYNASVIFLAQEFYKVDPDIRSQFNYTIVYKFPSAKKIREFADTFATDITATNFRRMYKAATAVPHSALLIDHSPNAEMNPVLKYRQNILGLMDEKTLKKIFEE